MGGTHRCFGSNQAIRDTKEKNPKEVAIQCCREEEEEEEEKEEINAEMGGTARAMRTHAMTEVCLVDKEEREREEKREEKKS